MRRKIVRARFDDGSIGLFYRDGYDPEGDGATIIKGLPRLEELADLCDSEAENCNAHDFVGAHRALAAILCKIVGRSQATKAMREIAELGGLDGATGVCGQDDAWEEIGVPEMGDWKAG